MSYRGIVLAESRGVEPHPISENPVFKAGRRTNPAALLSVFLEHRVRFELTVLGICNPLRWAAPPPVHYLVSDARIELALLGPKPRVIPFHQSENIK
jgi:hypothetical protein